MTPSPDQPERQCIEADLVCVGFGPAVAGFLTTLTRSMMNDDGTPRLESKIAPGMPLQISCYERADDISFGVSGVATRARAIRESFPDFDPSQVSMAAPIEEEKLIYLLDPIGASRRSIALRIADKVLRFLRWLPQFQNEALTIPYVPSFLRKERGFVLSLGQFLQWAGSNLLGSGLVVIWPGTPVRSPILEENEVKGVRLVDQGVDKDGEPTPGYMPGMDVRAALTVVGDGPVGAVGQQLDERFGMPEGNHPTEWAVGAKMVVELKDEVSLEAGTIYHTIGFPEPEIFGFMYAHTERTVSVGIFVPSWFKSPVKTSYRYLQHWMMHPFLWKYLEGGTLRSWGAKSLQESGRRGEPFLAGDGYARIGEGSGSTNILTGSGVDEAWMTGIQLAKSVIRLLEEDKTFSKENLENTYVRLRRSSWVEAENRIAEKSRDGFSGGLLRGMFGMALTGLSKGRFNMPAPKQPGSMPTAEQYYKGKISPEEIQRVRDECKEKNLPAHDALMDQAGWPQIRFDGKLLISQQDALFLGGKVQAAPGFADHVAFLHPEFCEDCGDKVCVEICSGQAIERAPGGGVRFDREKCVHCGACFWSCTHSLDESGKTNIEFRAGSGGLHSAEN